jgi:hypothetical protein
MYKPSLVPQSSSAQRLALDLELRDLEAQATMWKQTQQTHRDRMSSYRAGLERRYFILGQVYDFETDANIQYWNDQIAFCDYELGLLRRKFKRIRKLIDANPHSQ